MALHRYLLPGVAFSLLVGLSAFASAPAPQKAGAKPTAPVDYAKQIKPLLSAKCAACHDNGTKLGDLEIGTRAALLKGGASGAAIVPGSSEKSLLILLVSGHDPARIMPAKGPRLTSAEIALLSRWIDEGASFGKAGKTVAPWRPMLAPRAVVVPPAAPGSGITNPIDRLLQPYFQAHPLAAKGKAAKTPTLVDDRTYARRVYQDIVGLLPPQNELQAFVADKTPDKRTRLARKLLAENDLYAEHYLSFWNDMLRNDYAGTGYIDGGRTQITDWLYRALQTNLPYDTFVAQLINPTAESAGFVKGIVWRGTVNASQTPPMQAAQNVSQVFMGVNLKCASCHNSFVSNWKLSDAYGMASIYSDKALELVRCDRPTGETATVKFIYPELGAIDATAPREARMERLAQVLTNRANGRLSRTLVNRLWARLMGRGLVEPTDEMDNRPWNANVLDWLAYDFANNGYDVKKTIERIVTSRAYQMPSVGLASDAPDGNFVFRGPVVKRLSAEQFVDAVGGLTGVWSPPAVSLRFVNGDVALPYGGRMKTVFKTGAMRTGAAPIDVDITGAQFISLVATDAGDGSSSDWADWINPVLVDTSGKETPLTTLSWNRATTGYGTIQVDKNIVLKPLRLNKETYEHGLGTHANSVITYVLPPGMVRFKAIAGPDTGALEQQADAKTSVRFFVVTGQANALEGRAVWAMASPLTRALGRPNREQVVTERSTSATTLQSLELTNGRDMSNLLKAGALRFANDPQANKSPDALVRAVYAQALNRAPTPSEAKEAVALVGSPVRADGVEDLLWALIMQPEFQLVY